jgi:hypothetical protein
MPNPTMSRVHALEFFAKSSVAMLSFAAVDERSALIRSQHMRPQQDTHHLHIRAECMSTSAMHVAPAVP